MSYQIVKFSNIAIAILDFSILLLVNLPLLIMFASFIYFRFYSYRSSMIFIVLKGNSDKFSLLFAIAFKIEKKRQLYRYWKSKTEEAIDQCKNRSKNEEK